MSFRYSHAERNVIEHAGYGRSRCVGAMESEGAAELVADLLNATREIAPATLKALIAFRALDKLAREWERRAIGAACDAADAVCDQVETLAAE